jgi:hypothetical protein
MKLPALQVAALQVVALRVVALQLIRLMPPLMQVQPNMGYINYGTD